VSVAKFQKQLDDSLKRVEFVKRVERMRAWGGRVDRVASF